MSHEFGEMQEEQRKVNEVLSESDVPMEEPKLRSPRRIPSGDPSTYAAGFIVSTATKSEEKKNFFQKKFTDEDEIALLKGLQLFWANGRNNKWSEFYASIKDDLPQEFTKIQVSEKIRRLRNSFEANLKKARANGGNLDFYKDHEAYLYELSEILWGDMDTVPPSGMHDIDGEMGMHDIDGEMNKSKLAVKRSLNENDASGARKKDKKMTHMGHNDGEMQEVDIGKEKEKFESAFPLLCSSFNEFEPPSALRDNYFLIGREKGRELEEKFIELKRRELYLKIKRLDLTQKYMSKRSF